MSKTIKNGLKLFPYTVAGRWYKVFVETTETGAKITTADVACHMSEDNTMVLFDDIAVIDIKSDVHALGECITHMYPQHTGDYYGFMLPAITDYDYATFYVFGHKK